MSKTSFTSAKLNTSDHAYEELAGFFSGICLPLLILHGEADIVTDPSVSKALYGQACSNDKKLCLYRDSYHALLEGELDMMTLFIRLLAISSLGWMIMSKKFLRKQFNTQEYKLCWMLKIIHFLIYDCPALINANSELLNMLYSDSDNFFFIILNKTIRLFFQSFVVGQSREITFMNE